MTLLSPYLSRKRNAVTADYVRGDVLDIGCQQGQLRERLAGQIDRYTGIDLRLSHIEEARHRHPDCEFQVIDIDDEPLGYDSEFDTIVLVAVIEHIFNLKHLGRNLARALKPGGQVILTTPTPFGNDVVHRLGAALGLFSQKAADDHIVIFNRKRLDIFARQAGLSLTEHRRFQFGCNQMAILRRPAAALVY
jgi:2-polyprenyl-3-methyl-5-hydroxy-6-metoxy-1,4-benzoquinol methylase